MSIHEHYGLDTIERNVLIVTAKTKRNFNDVAKILLLKSASEAENIFNRAYKKLLHSVHGQPENWLSAKKISVILGVDWKWAQRRLENNFKQLAVVRRAPNGMEIAYYPPKVLEALQQMRIDQKSTPAAGDYVTLIRIAKTVGKTYQ